jgi:hypothetical protein
MLTWHASVNANHCDVWGWLVLARSLGLVTCNAGSTALHIAAMRGSTVMAEFLLDTWAIVSCFPSCFVRPIRLRFLSSRHLAVTPRPSFC